MKNETSLPGHVLKPAKPANDILMLAILLAGALLLRMLLVFTSGGFLDYDGEEFFLSAGRMYGHLLRDDWLGVLEQPVFSHWGAVLFNVVPYFLKPSWLLQTQVSALFFAVPSVINILLVYAIARRISAHEKAPIIAAALYALSVTSFYLVKSVHPGDLSLMFFMLGILLTLGEQCGFLLRFAAGFLYFFCFFTYYGYWTVAFMGMLFTTLYGDVSLKGWIARGLASSAGFLLPLMVFIGMWHLLQVDFLQHFFGFAATIDYGDFAEGHILPLLFLWYADGLMSVLWMACLALAFTRLSDPAVRYLLAAVLLLYLLWVVCSNALHLFVLYGRIVKAVVPLLCLLSALMLARLDARMLLAGFLLLLPFTLYKAWQLTKVEVAGFKNVQEQMWQEKLPAGRKIVTSLHCEPASRLCNQPVPTDCRLLEAIPVAENLVFNHYEGFGPEIRPLMRQGVIHIQLLDCPAQ